MNDTEEIYCDDCGDLIEDGDVVDGDPGYHYHGNCVEQCRKCCETQPLSRFDAWETDDDVCNGCTSDHYCEGCDTLVDEWVSNSLCDECDTKQNPHDNYTEIMASLEGLEQELANHKIVLVTGLCCGSCSAAAGYNRAKEKGWRGYAHWNEQSEDSLRRGADKLHIGFWSVDDNDTAAKRVRTSIIKALRRVGAWHEPHTDINQKIEVIVPQQLTEHGLIELANVGE